MDALEQIKIARSDGRLKDNDLTSLDVGNAGRDTPVADEEKGDQGSPEDHIQLPDIYEAAADDDEIRDPEFVQGTNSSLTQISTVSDEVEEDQPTTENIFSNKAKERPESVGKAMKTIQVIIASLLKCRLPSRLYPLLLTDLSII